MQRLLLISVLATACTNTADPPLTTRYGSLLFSPCTLGAQFGAGTSVQCATLSVLENRGDPKSRSISLAIAWVPATSKASNDPVFLIAGGPGGRAREGFAGFGKALHALNEHHDLILVDQRGVGGSGPLMCSSAKLGDEDERDEALATRAAACAQKLSLTADLRFYSTTDAIEDLEEVRRALGTEQINLYGLSYGTRVAQQYAKRFTAHTRTLTLDGVVPNSLVLVGSFAGDFDEAVERQLAVCSKDPACAALGDSRERLATLLAKLEASPLPVRFRDAVTGEVTTRMLRRSALAELVIGWAYHPEAHSLLPLLLKEASEGRVETLAALAKSSAPTQEENVMYRSVFCTEDEPELVEKPLPSSSLMGTSSVTAIKAECEGWPRGARPVDFRAPLTGLMPVLLMSGELDPITPPRYADQVLASLPKGRHLVVQGHGHGALLAGCMPALFAQFVETADASSLDASCLDSISLSAPLTGFYGWSP